ncbi:glycosyltransferase family 4 protein [Botrimarina mediterranea]|uniref:Spore coat protein SA n=1 Tax=Botrimarina mediterranea TaxID=2528022 RepID=A0A518KA61_9BACT|nr:glycosyltransferase family 4 protein [Botrimarina mediterranea]QDV74679.1 Spore coat protein SA [Botrimarina mediterranea]QDV79315.1 Spore coat protein SA [Planctomycetes bacterium K2D]
MTAPSVLFIDQSGQLGGAELSLFDVVRTRLDAGAKRDTVALFTEGPFADQLRSAGVRVEVLQEDLKVQKNAGLTRHLAAAPNALKLALRLRNLATQHEVIYANTQRAAVIGGVAAKWARKPFLWHLRDMLDASHFSRANRRIAVLTSNACARTVIANSKATANAYRRAGGKCPTRIVYNGIDAVPFDKVTVEEANAVRRSFAVGEDTPLIGVFGRITEWKGHRILLEAIQCDELGRVQVVVVGDALFTDADRRLAHELISLTRRDALAGRVHWLGHRNDVPTLMKGCDAIVHCSTQPEPFGRVILEGQLAGRPVIAAAAGGALEIIEDGVNGLLTPPGDVQSLSAAIQRLLSDRELTSSLVAAGSRTARSRFTLASYVTAVEDVINAAVIDNNSCRTG